jgi:hypothetical protein
MSDPFFERIARIDAIIAKGPVACVYDRDLAELLSNDTLTGYFFNHLSDPAWLEPLTQAGKFKQVPAPVKNESEGTVGFPAWPQGEYLKRIASLAPNQVCRVIAELPSTDNPRVSVDIIDVALAIDPGLSVGLVPRVIVAIRTPYGVLWPQKVGSLVSYLCRERQISAALALAEAVLEVIEDPKQKEVEADQTPFDNLLEPRARFDLWEYEQILSKNIPDLVDATGDRALTLLCDLLDRAILLSDRRGSERRPQDLSFIWRPAIEEHQQNLNLGLKHLLVSAVRIAAERIARKYPNSVPGLVQQLEERGKSWEIFRRIALHVLQLFPELAPDLMRERLLDRELFDDAAMRHEYFLLQKRCFGRLPNEDQNRILMWIEAGPPNREEHRKSWGEFIGRSVTEEEDERYARQWKRDRLAPLQQYLDDTWKALYAAFATETGQPEHPEFVSYTEGGAFGPRSPIAGQELKEMSPAEVVEYLSAWQPSGDPIHGASIEGLARDLTAVVAERAQECAEAVAEFERLSEPTYIRGLIEGFQRALKEKRQFPWEPVLDLCQWAVTRERDIPGRKAEFFEMDPHWGWTRSTVVRLLTAGFASEENPIPFEMREQAWQAIEPATHDPDPTPEQEQRYVKGGVKEEYRSRGINVQCQDPLTNAINSVRGVAMETVVKYALWVRKGFEKSGNGDVLLARGFDAMPEVKKVLDEHLDTNAEPSITIRAVYGEYLPLLQLLGRKWTEENTARILPRNKIQFWHAAWDTYVCYCAPYDDVLDWLEEEYEFAVEQIGTHNHEWGNAEAPDYSLARHLMTFYWRGKVEDQGRLLDTFYNRAHGKLRGQTLNFVGWSLRNTKEPIPGEVAQRLKTLLERRVDAARQHPEGAAEELREYGWWFASGKFDDDWSLHQLLEVLRLVGWVEPDHLVVERLAEMSGTKPLQCIEALKMIVEGDKRGWGVLGWRDKAKEIVRAARKSGNREARETGEDLVNLLGSRGHFEFGELLKEPIA